MLKGMLEIIVSAWNGQSPTSRTVPSNVSVHTQILEFDNEVTRDRFSDNLVKSETISKNIDVTRKFYIL